MCPPWTWFGLLQWATQAFVASMFTLFLVILALHIVKRFSRYM